MAGFAPRCCRCQEAAARMQLVDRLFYCQRCIPMSPQRVQIRPLDNSLPPPLEMQRPVLGDGRILPQGYSPSSQESPFPTENRDPQSRLRPIPQWEDSTYRPIPHRPDREELKSTEDHFILNSVFPRDETLHTEFKACRPQNFEWTWAIGMLSKYICAFLNTDGGTLFYGIRDDHIVRGLELDAHMRDQMRIGIDVCCNKFQPEVPVDLISISFEQVFYPNGNIVRETFVMVLKVKKGQQGKVYFTPNPDSKAWVKREASVWELKAQALVRFISTRLQLNGTSEPVNEPPPAPSSRALHEPYSWQYRDPVTGAWVEYPIDVQETLEPRKRLDEVIKLSFRDVPSTFCMKWLTEKCEGNSLSQIEAKRLDLRPSSRSRWVTFLNDQLYVFDEDSVKALEAAFGAGKSEIEVAMNDFTVMAEFDRMRLTGDLPLLRFAS